MPLAAVDMSMEQIGRDDRLTSPKVGFLIAGTQRAGTTTLRKYLFHHPDLCMPARKELHFFDDDKVWQSPPPDYAPYHAAFPVKPSHRLLGEATPIYMYWKPALPRIRDYNPEMKLIMLLRNPITRAYSHWNFERYRGRESLPFREALLAEPSRTEKARPAQLRNESYIQRGMYTGQLAELWRFFPPEQTLVLRFDDLRRAVKPLCAQIARFLAIRPFVPVREVVSNAREYASPLSVEDRNYLAGIFEEEIRSLERLLGWDCSDWLAGPDDQ
jgi:hypothetical protein